ncbi:hypothetical protein CIB48_g2755 [Xylaria polymorpha]|nr:hypothetical protein CIB48_g2755 [Xylaria polymorpha]
MENTALPDAQTSTPTASSNHNTLAHLSASNPNSQLGNVAPSPSEERIVGSDATGSSKGAASTRSGISSIAPSSYHQQSDKVSIKAVSNLQSDTPAIGTSPYTPAHHVTTEQSTALVGGILDPIHHLPAIAPSTNPDLPSMAETRQAYVEEWVDVDLGDREVPDWRPVEV